MYKLLAKFLKIMRLRGRRLLLILCSVMLVCGIIIYVIVLGSNDSKQNLTSVCTQNGNSAVLNSAAAAIKDSNLSTLITDAKKVANINGYKNDPNCLYVLFQASVRTWDFPRATDYLELMKKLPPKTTFYKAFGNPSIKSLEAQLQYEQLLMTTTNKNTVNVRDTITK